MAWKISNGESYWADDAPATGIIAGAQAATPATTTAAATPATAAAPVNPTGVDSWYAGIGRTGDAEGMNYWNSQIASKGQDAARNDFNNVVADKTRTGQFGLSAGQTALPTMGASPTSIQTLGLTTDPKFDDFYKNNLMTTPQSTQWTPNQMWNQYADASGLDKKNNPFQQQAVANTRQSQGLDIPIAPVTSGAWGGQNYRVYDPNNPNAFAAANNPTAGANLLASDLVFNKDARPAAPVAPQSVNGQPIDPAAIKAYDNAVSANNAWNQKNQQVRYDTLKASPYAAFASNPGSSNAAAEADPYYKHQIELKNGTATTDQYGFQIPGRGVAATPAVGGAVGGAGTPPITGDGASGHDPRQGPIIDYEPSGHDPRPGPIIDYDRRSDTNRGGIIGGAQSSAATYTPTLLGDPSQWKVTSDQTAQGQMAKMIDPNNPYYQAWSHAGAADAAARGFTGNSSLRETGILDSVMRNATPIAINDAGAYSKAAGYNTDVTNQFSVNNQNASNTAGQFNAGQQNQLTGQLISADTQRYATDVGASTSRANTQDNNATTRYTSDSSNATSRANTADNNTTQRYATDVGAATSLSNTASNNATQRYGVDSSAATTRYTSDAGNATSRANTDANNKTQIATTAANNATQLANTGLSTASQAAISKAHDENSVLLQNSAAAQQAYNNYASVVANIDGSNQMDKDAKATAIATQTSIYNSQIAEIQRASPNAAAVKSPIDTAKAAADAKAAVAAAGVDVGDQLQFTNRGDN